MPKNKITKSNICIDANKKLAFNEYIYNNTIKTIEVSVSNTLHSIEYHLKDGSILTEPNKYFKTTCKNINQKYIKKTVYSE
ncbi:MAG: hypothetical protein DRG78_04665 [Epsilonproteobacteria bacterium]|nr:MAG: hypothetical protein DRG78_04665 [Campylobacterota bacterium]